MTFPAASAISWKKVISTGFTDYNYFCRVFKKEVGVPAKKYRNLIIIS